MFRKSNDSFVDQVKKIILPHISLKQLIFIKKILFSLNCDRLNFAFQTLDFRLQSGFKV